MKKRVLSVILVLLILVSLTACSMLPHIDNSEKESADVLTETAATTVEQNEEVTEVCEHQWIEATCTEPKTCNLCGITEGEPLGHDFAPATVDFPKKCKVCGLEEGEAIKVTKIDFPFKTTDYALHSLLGDDYFIFGNHSDAIDGGGFDIFITDLNGNKIYEDYIANTIDGKHSWFISSHDGLLYWFISSSKEKSYLEVYKFNGHELEQIFKSDVNTGKYKHAEKDDYEIVVSNEQYYGVTSGGYTFIYDIENNCLGSEENIENDEDEAIEYDESLWSYYGYNAAIDGYMVGTADRSSWGYLDKDGNEIAMYADATDFSSNGYALVSKDGGTYSIIDKDFNIVGDGLFEGTGAYLDSGWNSFVIEQADETPLLVKVE